MVIHTAIYRWISWLAIRKKDLESASGKAYIRFEVRILDFGEGGKLNFLLITEKYSEPINP